MIIKIANWLNRKILSRYSEYEWTYGYIAEKLLEGTATIVKSKIDPVTHKPNENCIHRKL